MYQGFSSEQLGDGHVLYCGRLPAALVPDQPGFQALWDLHPAEYHQIVMLGKRVNTPRWQQAYGKDYVYSRETNTALPIPGVLLPYHDWVRRIIDVRLNGLLLNWYDGALGHYIGKHRDSIASLVPGTPIVTISLGEDRLFRLRQWKGNGQMDFTAHNDAVLVMPWETNLSWTHEVPRQAKYKGQRISITFRAFQ